MNPISEKDVAGDKALEQSKITVSIVTITYRHEKFIRQTLEGFIKQKTDFEYELIIGDDHSPDRTAEIIHEYAKKYSWIHPVLRTANLGALPNLMDLISRTHGKYVAICDGDDFWTDEKKLQKQVNFLENHPEFSGCCHPVLQTFDDGSMPDSILAPLTTPEQKSHGYLTIHDLIRENSIASLSIMYRWSISRTLPAWMSKYRVGDYPLLLFHADKGNIGVLSDIMGIYRRHSGGSWLEHNKTEKQLLEYLSLLSDIHLQLGERYHADFDPIFAYIQNVDLPKARKEDEQKKAAVKTTAESTAPMVTEKVLEIRFKLSLSKRLKGLAKKILKRILPGCIWRRGKAVYHSAEYFEYWDSQLETLSFFCNNTITRLKDLEERLTTHDALISRTEETLKKYEVFINNNTITRLKDLEERLTTHDALISRTEETLKKYEVFINDFSSRLLALEKNSLIVDLKNSLVWELLRNMVQSSPADGKTFRDALEYQLVRGNFVYFPDNYDKQFVDPKEIQKWKECIVNDFSQNLKSCLRNLGESSLEGLTRCYEKLADSSSRILLAKLIAWRLQGFTKIKLLPEQAVQEEADFYRNIDSMRLPGLSRHKSMDFELDCYDLKSLGFPICCYAIPCSIVMDFLRLQYENEYVNISPGDIVLDCGGCWGDTALLFAYRTGKKGKVYSFEFVNSNIEIFKKNMKLNPELFETIELVQNPVSNQSGLSIPVVDKGTSSSIFSATPEGSGKEEYSVRTVSIDDFVMFRHLERVDFLKMDIEGAEMAACRGAAKTISRFLPKLAIAVYHCPDDIWQIPELIHSFSDRYKFYLKHNSRCSLETILLAVPEKKK